MATSSPATLIRDPLEPQPLIEGAHTDRTINDSLLEHVWRGAGKGWWALFGVALSALALLVIAISWTLYKGIGSWGNNIPVGWAFGIINFVWWIGIGHAGTLISAILLLLQQKWRTSINRFAEAMTLFAVICALLFPLLHHELISRIEPRISDVNFFAASVRRPDAGFFGTSRVGGLTHKLTPGL